MSSHLQWPDLLEEEAYLVQMVSENVHDSGALEQTSSTLDILRADLQSCASKVADLERDIRESDSKGTPSPGSSSTSRFIHRITASISSDHSHEDKERGYDVLNERLLNATTNRRTLNTEIRNLEVKAQVLRRRARHHEELKHRLKMLYERVFGGSMPSSPEEDEAEKEVRKALQALHQTQKTMECHRTLTALLGHGDYALSNAAPHLSAAVSSGKKGAESKIFQSEIIAAKSCVLQAYIVVDQAKRIDPHFFAQGQGDEVFKQNWMSSVFRAQPSGNAPQHSPTLSSQQALQSQHTTLLTLLTVARQKWQEYETNLRRATRRHAEAWGRKHAIRRQILLKYAGIEGNQDERSLREADGSRSGLARIRDVTAGLDQYVAVVAPPSLAVPQSDTGDERRRASGEEERRFPNRDQPMGRSLDVATFQTQPRPLTPNSMRRTPSPNPMPYARAQGSSGVSSEAVITPHRPPPSSGAARPQAKDTRTGSPQPRVLAQNNLRPSFDNPAEELRGKGAYESPRPPPPIQPLPGASGSVSGDSRYREVRRDLQPPADTLPRLPGQLNAVDRSRAPPMQPLSGSVRPNEVGSPPGYGNTLRDINEDRSAVSITQPQKRTAGILKARGAPPPPPPTDLTDPWGVKIAAAGPSRPRPKLKNIISNALRSVEGFKGGDNQDARSDSVHGSMSETRSRGSPPVTAQAPAGQEASSPHSHWTTMQKLRFSETVAMIPRPAVDSDPYEDEEYDYIPTGDEVEDDDDDDDSTPVAFSQRGPIQVDPAPKSRDFANASSHSQESPLLSAYYTQAHTPPSGPDLTSSLSVHSQSQRHAISQNPRIYPIDTPQERSRQVALEGARSANAGDRPQRDVGTARAYAEQSRVTRTLSERVSSDDLHLETRKALMVPKNVDRFTSPSDPNLPASSGHASRNPTAQAHTMTRGGPETRSDHNLVQTIFPSPSSTISERDLLFTN